MNISTNSNDISSWNDRSRNRSMIATGFQLSSASTNSPFEQYSSKIPASIRGALNHTTDIGTLSARFSRNGYCWLVSGQTAYVWLSSSHNRLTDAVIHHELKLPECVLGQQANLIELFTMNSDGTDACSCLVITGDGYARFWRTIVRTNEYYDVKLEFDQIELLCHFKDDICICGSYSGRLYTIPCNALCNKAYIRPTSTSILSSIGFGIKSMLFGTSRQMKDNEILRWFHSLKSDSSNQTTATMNVDLISLTDKNLYFWYVADKEIQLVHALDLQQMFTSEANKESKNADQNRNVSCISFTVIQETIYVLAIHYNTHDYRLMLGVFSLNHSGVQLVSFHFLTNHLNIRLDEIIVKPRVRIFAVPNQPALLIHTKSDAFIYTGPDYSIFLRASFSNMNETILGSGMCSTRLLLFCHLQGLITPKNQDLLSAFLSKTTSNDPFQPMINAFHTFLVQNDPGGAVELFRRFLNSINPNQLDDIVVEFGNRIIDDSTLQSETSDLQRHLTKKLDIYNYYFSFLKLVAIWNKLHVAHFNSGIYYTKQILQQFGEKLQCANAFSQASHQSLYLQAALRSVSRQTQISHLSEVLTAILMGAIETNRQIDIQSYEEATRLLTMAFDSIKKYRDAHAQESFIPINPMDEENYSQSMICQPWILYEQNLTDLFVRHCTDHFQQAIQASESREARDRLLSMTARLIYLVLNEYRLYICDLYSDDCNAMSEQRPWLHYKLTRSKLIRVFIQLKEYSKGKQLAEQFEDFGSMIEICDELKDVTQLRQYIEQHRDKFLIVFEEYLRSTSAVSVLFQSEYFQLDAVQHYLKSKPEFCWMTDIKNRNYENASLSTLQQAAETIGQRQTLLAISKFALLASSQYEIRNSEAVNLRLRFIENEENLCYERLDLLSNLEETDRLKQPLITPKEMIKNLVLNKNASKSLIQRFCSALKILSQMESNPEFDQLRLFVFAEAILADPLKPIKGSADPYSSNSQTLLCQLFEFIKRENLDKFNLIPSREKLQTAQELRKFQNNADFHQALSAIYSSLLTIG